MTGGSAVLGQPLRNQGAQGGMGRARRWAAISDGGAGIEDWLRANVPRVAAVILDFDHAAEYLSAWPKVPHPAVAAAAEVAKTWRHRLKHEGGGVVLAALKRMDVPSRSATVREAHRVAGVYFGNPAHRMDDPRYRAKGWVIGSGPVEAACKPVVGQRLNGTGMRWGEPGADAVCHLSALF